MFWWHCECIGNRYCCTVCLVCLLLCFELPLMSIGALCGTLCGFLCWSIPNIGVLYVLQTVSERLQS